MKNEFQIKAKAISTMPLAKKLHVAACAVLQLHRVRVDYACLLIHTLTAECLQSCRVTLRIERRVGGRTEKFDYFAQS